MSEPTFVAFPSGHSPEPVTVAELPVMSRVTSTLEVEQVELVVEVTRIVPASGNLALRRQQFWLGPARAGIAVTLWVDRATKAARGSIH